MRGMELADLFARHVARLQEETEKSLAETGYDSLVVSSGAPHTYFADDQDAVFHGTPASVTAVNSGPFAVAAGNTLLVRIDNGPEQTLVFSDLGASASASDVAAAIVLRGSPRRA